MKRILTLIFLLLFACNGYCATQLEHTVEEDGNGDFTSLSAAVDHLESTHSNLVTADVYADIKICGTELGGNGWTNADTTEIVIHNITTDSTHYINIYTTATARHNGKAASVSGRNNYRIDNDTINLAHLFIEYNTKYVTINGIEFLRSTAGYWDCGGIYIGPQCDGSIIKNCLLANMKVKEAAIFWYVGRNGYIYNNIIYNISANGNSANHAGIECAEDTGTTVVYNNTIYNAVVGIVGNGTKVLLKNNISYNNIGDDYGGSFSSASTNNLASDTTTPEYNTYYDSKTLTFVSTTSGSEDLHLVATDTDAIDKGADLSGTFTDDIDGDTRSGTWDIGADEYVNPIQTNLIFNNVVLNYVIGN